MISPANLFYFWS